MQPLLYRDPDRREGNGPLMAPDLTIRKADESISPLAMVGAIVRNRNLIWRLARRELEARYRGSHLGLLWIVLLPLLMLSVYTFAFGVVFKARWAEANTDSPWVFAIFLFAGLSFFNVFAEMVARAPSLMTENASYIKKLLFPIEILPVVQLLVSLFNFMVSLILLLAMQFAVLGPPPLTAFLTPLALLPLALFSLGLTWFLSALGVYLRDLRQIVGVAVTIALFLSPVFFPVSAVPVEVRSIIQLNPLSTIVETGRNVLFFGRVPDWGPWMMNLLFNAFVAWLGFAWFTKTRRGFADVI